MKNIVKKLVLVAAVVVLAMGLFACGGGSKGITGEWKIDEITASGVTISNKDYKSLMGSDIGTFTFKDDGTCTMSVYGTDTSLKYTVDGNTVTIGDGSSGGDITGKISGSKITIEEESANVSIVLKKS